jgi:hypothetical protein
VHNFLLFKFDQISTVLRLEYLQYKDLRSVGIFMLSSTLSEIIAFRFPDFLNCINNIMTIQFDNEKFLIKLYIS